MGNSLRSLFLLGVLVLPETRAGSHSLTYFHNGWTGPELGEPRFVYAAFVDYVEFVRFDSDSPSLRAEQRAPWMERVVQVDPDYWEREARIGRENAQVYREKLETLQRNHNQSEGGVYTIQHLHGCEVSPEGRLQRGFSRYAYNGQDYNAPDAKSWTCVEGPPAEMYKHKVEGGEAGSQKASLEEECVKLLLQYLEIGKEELTRTDPPSAWVTHHTAPDGEVTLRCRAQDFYPAEISLTWLRDGEEQLQDMEFIETRPGGDGTFQKWVTVGVTPGQEGRYTCRVQHEGMADPLTLKWEPPSSSTQTILCVLLVLFLLTAVLAGVVIWRKNNSGENGGTYIQAANSDCGSEASIPT